VTWAQLGRTEAVLILNTNGFGIALRAALTMRGMAVHPMSFVTLRVANGARK